MTIEQIAKDFGVHTVTLQKWLQRAAVDYGVRPGQSRTESVEVQEVRKRIRLLEQENEVLRRAAAYLRGESAGKGFNPLVKELAADRIPVAVALGVPPAESEARGGTGPQALPPALLAVAGQSHHRQ